MATKYMHTINGEPAYFVGEQICFATRFGRAIVLADSLRTIRFQQLLTKQFRIKNKLRYDPKDYGHVRVAT